MFKTTRTLFYILLLLAVSSTVAAQDMLVQQGCRRGMHSSQQNSLRRGAAQPRTPGGSYYKGERHQLVVLAAFSDCAFKGDGKATLEQWEKIFNQENYTEESLTGSVHDYFYDQSYGQFDLKFDLHYINVGERKTYASTASHDDNSKYLVIDVVESLQKQDIDWSIYDWNNDGFINQILIVFAGKGSSYGGFGGGYDAIWPHQLWLSSHDNCSPITINYGSKNYQVDCYCTVQELSSAGNYGSFGTICHEYTHCFGFPDFYNGSTKYVGQWDLMDNGNYNNNGFTPCGYSAHEKMLMEWLTPTELTSAASITDMEASSDKPQAYLIRNGGHENEYYIVENRQQSGWDKNQPGNGIVVFHIDFDSDIWTGINSEYPNSYSKQRYTIFPANNYSYPNFSYGWPYPYNSNNELTNESSPKASLNNANSDGTYLMSKPLTNMTVTDGRASFDFMGGTTAIDKIINSPQQTEYTILHQIGPVSIVRYADGTVNKIINSNY